MTEKRFKNVGKDILQYSEWWCSAGGEHCADVIATAMNELIKENEQLKQDNQRLIKMLDNVANYMQKEHREIPLDDFVEWWNKMATEGLEND